MDHRYVKNGIDNNAINKNYSPLQAPAGVVSKQREAYRFHHDNVFVNLLFQCKHFESVSCTSEFAHDPICFCIAKILKQRSVYLAKVCNFLSTDIS